MLPKTKKSGAVESLDKTSWDLYKKMGATSDYTDFKIETSPSIEKELYETNAALLIEAGRTDEALALIEKGLKNSLQVQNCLNFRELLITNPEKMDAFIANLKVQTEKNPTDANNWYNLGVLQSKDPATVNDAIASYKSGRIETKLRTSLAKSYLCNNGRRCQGD